MPLESIFDNNLNIKQMVIPPEQTQKQPFDLYRDVEKRDWDALVEYIRATEPQEAPTALRVNSSAFPNELKIGVPETGIALARLRVLFPQHPERIPATAQLRAEMMAGAQRFSEWLVQHQLYEPKDIRIYCSELAHVKLLFPDVTDEELGVNESFWSRVIPIYNTLRRDLLQKTGFYVREDEPALDSSVLAVSLRILSPDNFKKRTSPMNDAHWESYHGWLEKYYTQSEWHKFTILAAELKILFPQHSQDLFLDDRSWQGMKEHFNQYRNDHQIFPMLAMYLAILAADRIVVGEGNIQIHSLKNKSQFVPNKPLPQIRKF